MACNLSGWPDCWRASAATHGKPQLKIATMPIDLVNRFAPTPLQSTFNVSGKLISLATNCPDLLRRIAGLAPECGEADMGQLDCSWRIVTEPETDEVLKSPALNSRYVRDDG